MRTPRVAALLSVVLLGLAGPVALPGAAQAATSSFPTTTVCGLSATKALYRQALSMVCEVWIQFPFLDKPLPIPPSDQDKVVLQRRGAGQTSWHAVSTQTATGKDKQGNPMFVITGFKALGNARYRGVFRSTRDGFESSDSKVAGLQVFRLMHDRGVNRKGRLFILGNVDPGWAHRTVTFQRRSCGTCDWHRYARVRTGSRGQYRVRVYPPKRGEWQYRGFVPSTRPFALSSTHVFTVRAPKR